jgi:cytochrome c oxidase cbb3-type subunit I/II
MDQCAGCHGEHADGRSPMGPSMRPPAFDLADFELSESLIWRVLQEGVPGSEMPAWNGLSDAELLAVVRYVSSLGNSGALPKGQRWADSEVLQKAGWRVYASHCVRCHGVSGNGEGPEAARYFPHPSDFTEMRPSYEAGSRVIRNGVHGSAMPGWPLLTDAEVQAVTHYIRSLYRWPEPNAQHNRRRAVVHRTE